MKNLIIVTGLMIVSFTQVHAACESNPSIQCFTQEIAKSKTTLNNSINTFCNGKIKKEYRTAVDGKEFLEFEAECRAELYSVFAKFDSADLAVLYKKVEQDQGSNDNGWSQRAE